MSCLWICLSLLYAATFLHSSVSSNEGVSPECNKTVEVVAGETVTLYCSINSSHCKSFNYIWRNTHGNIPCDSRLMNFSCEWDDQTYVSLTISNVMEEDNYTVSIHTDCGWANSSPIKVQVKQHPNITLGEIRDREQPPSVIPAVLGIFITIAVFGILFFLFGSHSGRQKAQCIKTRKRVTRSQTL